MTHCAIVPLITCTYTYKVYSHFSSFFRMCIFSFCSSTLYPPLAWCLTCPVCPALPRVCDLSPHLVVRNGTNCYLLSPAGSGVLLSTSPNSCRETKAEPQHCSFSVYGSFLSFRNVFFLYYYFFALENGNLNLTNLKIFT